MTTESLQTAPAQAKPTEAKSARIRIKNQVKANNIQDIAPLLEKLEILSRSPESRELQQKTYREVKESLIR